ncbi:hypothetical protein BC831DRAFT_404480 [Entophlyctis helioformis]|nr:hypothetical protein BC831DRAFT_404480 [Entophlyctis helioformis]
MTDATVEAMARHCPNLEKLDIRGCRNVSEAALRALVDNCPHLSVLKLEGPGGWETTSSLAPMRPSRSVLSSSISSATMSSSSASSMASMSVPSSPSPLPPRSRRPPRVVLSQAELSRRAFLNELKRRFPSDELVRLEESVL